MALLSMPLAVAENALPAAFTTLRRHAAFHTAALHPLRAKICGINLDLTNLPAEVRYVWASRYIHWKICSAIAHDPKMRRQYVFRRSHISQELHELTRIQIASFISAATRSQPVKRSGSSNNEACTRTMALLRGPLPASFLLILRPCHRPNQNTTALLRQTLTPATHSPMPRSTRQSCEPRSCINHS
jgi:hypothetical protein